MNGDARQTPAGTCPDSRIQDARFLIAIMARVMMVSVDAISDEKNSFYFVLSVSQKNNLTAIFE